MFRSVPLLLALCASIGCSNVEKAKPQPKPVKADRSFQIDVPEIMRGTIASETVVLGYESQDSPGYQPVVASGYGLVVGLNGTGSRNIPPQLRAHMIAEAARYGIGSAKYGDRINALTPERLIDSLDTAVVIVQAVIPQAAPKDTRFDVRVSIVPGTETTSLEGGTLYTTELRPGPPTTGGAQASPLAQASGPVFVNPFAQPGAVGRDAIDRTTGRILNGGVVAKDMPLKLRLSNPSHARASIIQSAINTRFPQEPGQRDQTARGESDEVIQLAIPPSYADRTQEFIEVLRHTTIAQNNPEAVAMSVRRAMLANPMVAEAASVRWQALGVRALPIIKDLYDHPEEMPRMAALQAGAKLNDALVVPHLMDMTRRGSADSRLKAIQLLAEMRTNPQIDIALRKLLDDEDVEIRLEAYEALAKRRDPYMRRFAVDRKFLVDVVDSSKPMVYITQLGQPRIVIFGNKLTIEQPATVRAWDNRFMLKSDLDEDLIEVYYRKADSTQGVILRTEPSLERFVHFLGHTTTVEKPQPGLGMTYAEAVGVIYQIWQQRYLKADFKADQDRILAAINRIRDESTVPERPEFLKTDEPDLFMPDVNFGPTGDLGRLNSTVPPLTSSGFEPVAP